MLNILHMYRYCPGLMFFPEFMNQAELKLFGRFKDDNYYRAFKLVEDIKEA